MDSNKKNKPSAEQPAEKDSGSARKTMGDGYVPRIDYALRAKLAQESEQNLSQDPIAAALRAAEGFDLEADAEESFQAEGDIESARTCGVCGKHNPAGTLFCVGCGVPIETAMRKPAPWEVQSRPTELHGHSAQHHYHHHYHHHYFGQEQAIPQERAAISPPAGRDSGAARIPLSGTGLSKAEAAVRKLAQDWAQSCNTKHLDDLVELYATDALVLRPNVPPVRGTAAIREFFFSVLDAGLGEVEMDSVRVEIFWRRGLRSWPLQNAGSDRLGQAQGRARQISFSCN